MSGRRRSSGSSRIPKLIRNRFPGTTVSVRDEERAKMKRLLYEYWIAINSVQLENDSLKASFKCMVSVDFPAFRSRIEKLEKRVHLLRDMAASQMPSVNPNRDQFESNVDENLTSICMLFRDQPENAISQMSTAICELTHQLQNVIPDPLEIKSAPTLKVSSSADSFKSITFSTNDVILKPSSSSDSFKSITFSTNDVINMKNVPVDDDDDWLTMNDDNFDSDCDDRSMETILDSDAEDEPSEKNGVRKPCNAFGYHQLRTASDGGYTLESKIGDFCPKMKTSLTSKKPTASELCGDGLGMTKTSWFARIKFKALSGLNDAICWMVSFLLRARRK